MACLNKHLGYNILIICSLLLLSSFSALGEVDEYIPGDSLKAMKYRLAGPYRGGRVTAVTGVPGQPFTYYFGATGGGVWKTTDAGQSWNNVSDGYLKVGSIGAVAVAESDPNVVYVGTGSGCPRGNVSPGDGVYKSTDAGKTWTHAGLKDAGQISEIRIHPGNPDIVYIGVLGNIFGPGEERGVFRSTNGGESWEKVLYVNDQTGVSALSMDKKNPRVLYAAMWRAERKPWTLIDGSPDGGLFKTVDGGDNWEKLDLGLSGNIGRMGVDVSGADPERLYVIVETDTETQGGVYRSDDGGETFAKINREHKLRGRAWYYNHIIADPVDENTVYIMNAPFFKSIDGGKTWSTIEVPHGDNHALWINPDNNQIMINGNDGGANVSFNGGETWSTQLNQPTAEFYRVTVDNQFPYRLYGAQQDNTTLSIPSWSPGGVDPKEHWYDVGGGESGHIAVHPENPDIIYAGNYIGQITRMNRKEGHTRDVVAYPQMHDGMAGRDIRYRFQWNAPIRISPHNPEILYHASQYIHRSSDGGQSWEVISPDLTLDKDEYHDIPGGPVQHDHTGVELYSTVFAFEESPHKAGVLWAGSDDGLIHISMDNGKNWKNITPDQMPAEGTVNSIDLSAHAAGRANVAVYKYRDNDPSPYIFQTDNYGESWTRLTDGNNGIPGDHFVRVVREDPVKKGLLYAGTEFGMFISFNNGTKWQPFQLNLPVVPVTDMLVHRNDLVIATQGRSFWILDDLTPVQNITPEVLEEPSVLFQPRNAYRTQARGFRGGAAPESPPYGAVFFYFLKERPEGQVTLEVLDPKGQVIRTFSSTDKSREKVSAEPGLNRFVWNFSYPAPEVVEGAVMSLARIRGAAAPPGKYSVKLTVGETAQTREFEIVRDPRWSATDSDLRDQFALASDIGEELGKVNSAIKQIRSIREQAEFILDKAKNKDYADTLKKSFEVLDEKMAAVEEKLIQTMTEAGQDPINYPPKLDNQFAYLLSIVNYQDAKPTSGCYERFDDLKREFQPIRENLDSIIENDLKDFNKLLEKEEANLIIL